MTRNRKMGIDISKDEVDGEAPAVKQPPGGRRGFLLGAGTAGAAGVAAVALGGTRTAPGVGEGTAGSTRTEASAAPARGYHETAHIRKYYDTTKV